MAYPTPIDQIIQTLLADAIKKIPADYAEIRAESSTANRISFRGAEPEMIGQPDSSGFFVRVLINGSWGISTFNDINLLQQKIDQAVNFAKLQGKGNVILAQSPAVMASINPVIDNDFNEVDFSKKVELVKHYNDLILKTDKQIQSTQTIYADSVLTKFFVNSRGSVIFQQRPYIRLTYIAVGRQDDVIETYRGSVGHQGGFKIVEGLEADMERVAKEAVSLAKAPKVKSGEYTVILDPYMAGTFAHEAFGHFSEADHQYENPQLLSQMEIGRKLGSEIVTIVDDPNINEGWGNFTYDDEGVLGQRVNLLTNGFISGRMNSLETAGKLGEMPSGRARADGSSSIPLIRMSNTFFMPGKSKLAEMIKSTKNGILVNNWIAGMTAMENFTFTGMYGEMITDGKVGQKVRGVKLSGNVFETLQNIDAISDDFAHDQGTCGKGGQSMPVGAGGGYVRVNKVKVGGE